MNFFLNGYYGYDNAGDEAVLAAVLDHIGALAPQASFTVTAGDTARTEANHGSGRTLRAIGRQNPKHLVPAIRACDVFISGGGSLLQDVTSVRNVVYYTSLLRFARFSRKPVMVYAQGVGPLNTRISQKLARAAMQSAQVITLRDEASRTLLQRLGVRRSIEVTADPVWALDCGTRNAESGEADSSLVTRHSSPKWGVALRSWPGEEGSEATRRLVAALREAAGQAGAQLCFLPMQFPADSAILHGAGVSESEIDGAPWRAAQATMAAVGACDLVIAMRLHALIFAGAQRVPCVAVDYDPKVRALAQIAGAPLIEGHAPEQLAKLPQALAEARAIEKAALHDLQGKARRNAELAVGLIKR